jgi:general secretion pathway protein G
VTGSLKRQKAKGKSQNGFSLLELMVAMFIMIILLSIAVPTYERSVRQAREIVLKENLFQMRRSIDQFRADKGKLPTSIDDLVTEKYLREKPIDSILEKAEWNEIQGEDTNSPDGETGLVDVKSLAEGEDSQGVAFSEY